MKILPLLLSVSYVQSKESTIECADCYFSYVEVNGYVTPMKGDQNCMTNPKIMPTKQFPSEGDVHGVKSRTKCTIVEATGVETIRYEDDDGQEQEFDVDYKIYDRTVFTVYDDTSFYDYNGELEFNEDAVMCGANRTECSGDMRERNLQEYICPAEKQCACPRCEWIRVKNKDGAWKDISGDRTCEKGTETSDAPCTFQPNRSAVDQSEARIQVSTGQSPLSRSRPTPEDILAFIPDDIKERLVQGQPRSNMGGNCIIYEEFWRQPKEVEFEQVNLYRICDKYLATPYNFYSTMVTNATSMSICDTDLCNQKGSSVAATLSIVLFIVIYSLF